ncbi:CD63 antigen-like [Anoplophora glabripennis]|uniref:CD63 antigen-like n=1 Tax=Anoplophora glabripennis TaxID=217634 RepID=UPI000874C730|nr:CD63 antigen-like [Anoplophora glabripennis]
MVTGGMSCVKYLIFCFNLLFALSGIAILTVGIIIQGIHAQYSNFLYSSYESIPLLLIIVGLVIFIVAFFGCCGAVKENHCMIITFSVLLFVILILEISAGIVGYAKRSEVEQMLENKLNSTMFEYYTNPDVKNTWDIAQHELECCGMRGPNDWYRVTKNDSLPHTCCPDTQNDGSCNIKSANKYKSSCFEKLEAVFVQYGSIMGGIGIGIAISQLIGAIFACCLARSIRKEYETV